MTAIDPNDARTLEGAENVFFGALRVTLDGIFQADSEIADQYRIELEASPPLQRALALHEHPLDVASMLTGLPVTSERIARYREIVPHIVSDDRIVASPPLASSGERLSIPRQVLTRLRDHTSPPIPLQFLNQIMAELGYARLSVRAGRAYFLIERSSRRTRHLPRWFEMPSLPERDADRTQVYPLDIVLALLDSLQEFSRSRDASDIALRRIQALRTRALRMFGDR